ncbi:hypothetical protein [Granulosicoccus antarcticus]|nr:hypothetical protein [Granulosicoccus antarcticus]
MAPVFDASDRLRVDHFYDNRLENDLSVDRLGEGQALAKVKVQLAPKAKEDNAAHPFKGWAGLKVKSLVVPAKTAVSLLPTPLVDNAYHADISREDYRTASAAYALAFRLREVSESDFTELLVDGNIAVADVKPVEVATEVSANVTTEAPQIALPRWWAIFSKFLPSGKS